MTDILDDTNKQIARRLAELKPQVEEYHRLQAATKALDGIPAAPKPASATSPSPTHGRRGPGRPRGSKTKTTAASVPASTKPALIATKPTAKRRRRRKRTSKRATQALALIRANPGITIPALAAKMGINANYLYRLLPPLEQQGKIHKDSHGWFPEKA